MSSLPMPIFQNSNVDMTTAQLSCPSQPATNEATSSTTRNLDRRANKQSKCNSCSVRHDTTFRRPERCERSAQGRVHDGKANEPGKDIKVTISVPSPSEEVGAGDLPHAGSLSFQSPSKPEDIRRLFGISEYQPRDHQYTYAGQRSYNYEEMYPADPPGRENDPEARFFKVYLDEAEQFDREKIRSHRDNIDSLLVFAALFSAVVTTFVVQTSQALQPDQSLITNKLLLYQIEILKVMGNNTAISAMAPSQYLPETPTHSLSDVWVNGLFFVSLALSISTALLSVLAKQWLQAYDGSMSGSARDRALVRHLRLFGSEKWKLDEIVGALPLVLHASVAVFLAGLIVYLRALYPLLSLVVIVISGLTFTLYFTSVILPAIDIECPYRIPVLYRPMRYVVLIVSHCHGKIRLVSKWLTGLFKVTLLSINVLHHVRDAFVKSIHFIRASSLLAFHGLQNIIPFPTSQPNLGDAEIFMVQEDRQSPRYLHYSIAWLHAMSSNRTVKRIAAQAVAGDACVLSRGSRAACSLSRICMPGLIGTASQALFEGEDLPPKMRVPGTDQLFNPSPWARALENLSAVSSDTIVQRILTSSLYKAMIMGRVNHVAFILDIGVDVDSQLQISTTTGR